MFSGGTREEVKANCKRRKVSLVLEVFSFSFVWSFWGLLGVGERGREGGVFRDATFRKGKWWEERREAAVWKGQKTIGRG